MSKSVQNMDTAPEQAKSSLSEVTGSSKRKAQDTSNKIQFTSRNPPWAYLKLQLVTQSENTSSQVLDALSARTYLTAAFSQYLGLTGTAIPIDILKVEPASSLTATSPHNISATRTADSNCVWIRVPCDDGAAVVAALSSWIGTGSGASMSWRVCAKGNFLGALVAGSGRDLFVP